jgi:hypothetical protein
MQKMSQPEHWFRNVKKIYVIESVDYYTRKGCTTIFIHYKAWWRLRRKLKFARIPRKGGDDQSGTRSPEAQAVILRLKESLSPSSRKTSFVKKTSVQGHRAVWSPFNDVPVLNGYGKPQGNMHSVNGVPESINLVGLEENKDKASGKASTVNMVFITVHR